MKKIFSCILCILTSLYANAAAYSFEDASVPTEWNSVANGSLSISSTRYKFQTKALRWDWNAGSVLTVSSPDNLEASSRTSGGGMDTWIYNENPSTNKLLFEYYNASNVKKCSLELSLNFKGWRRIIIGFSQDLRHDRTALKSMKVVAPSSGSGTIYFDAVEFQTSVAWDRISDLQYTVRVNSNNEDIDNFLKSRNIAKPSLPANVTDEEKAGYNTIVQRMDDWYFGTGKYASNAYYQSRYNAVNGTSSYVSRARNKMSSNILTEGADGVVTGKGLFNTRQTSINGISVETFRTYSENYFLPLSYDYRLNQKTDSRDYVLKMFEWYNNQGWADGSATGVLRFEKLRSGGYFHSAFLMRDAMSASVREREMNTVYWYSLFGDCYKDFQTPGETADNFRALAMPKLIYALMHTDDKERARALHAFSRYMNNSIAIAPGYSGTFKSDYSGYHHKGPYGNSYAPDALFITSLMYYMLYDTPYQLSDESYQIIKKSILEYYDFICSGYDVPQGLTGRFPANMRTLDEILPCIVFLALANEQLDPDLVGMLKRLWKPDVEPMKSWLSRINTDITFKSSLGALELILDAVDNSIPESPIPQGNRYFPYAGTFVSKSGSWQINVKGFSKYIWDFEGGSGENLYGRYMSNGTVQLVNAERGVNSTEVGDANWDWARFPGATAKYMDKNSLDFGGTNHRNFSDQAFMGGVALDDVGFFSVQLHDNTFDKTFYANKSVFAFGKNSYYIGDNIRCNSSGSDIETTLFQSFRSAGNFKANGRVLNANESNIEKPTIQDSYGNTFIVHEGNVNFSLNSTFGTAVIPHGTQPTAASYQYSLIFDATSTEIAEMKNDDTRPVKLLQRDGDAHIIQHVGLKTTAYALFSAGEVGHGLVDSVNTPSVILVKQPDDSTYQIVFSDPDMRKRTSARVDGFSYENSSVPSDSFDIVIKLNKPLWAKDIDNRQIWVDTRETETIITARVTEGLSHKLTLATDSADAPPPGPPGPEEPEPPTSVDKDAADKFVLYPNPTNGQLYVKGVDTEAVVRVYGVDGRMMKTQKVEGENIPLDITSLPKGSYFIEILVGGKTQMVKQILKQ